MSIRILKYTFVIVFVGYSMSAVCEKVNVVDWEKDYPYEYKMSEWEVFPRDRFCEVPISAKGYMSHALRQDSWVELPSQKSEWHPSVRSMVCPCSHGERAFLIRAIYANTGSYDVHRNITNGSILVVHSGLGKTYNPKKSALVVCMENSPGQAYNISYVSE